MISLITGLPGSGKTNLLVHELMTRDDLKNRPLFVDGIPELKIPTMEIPEGEDMTTWHKWAPTGAILVIDEAQRIFRPRPAGAKVPDYIQELETHRHKGIDIFVITQHPRLIDVNLRSLVGEHRNISRTMLGFKRISYWQRCANPESRADVAEAKNSIYWLKKDAFGMYKSAEEHNKLKGSLSSWIWLVPAVIAFVAYNGYSLTKRYQERMHPETVQEARQNAEQGQPQGNQSNAPQNATGGVYGQQQQMPAQDPNRPLSASDYIPSIDGQPWTAPIYNGRNRNIQTMPYPAACVKSGSKCTCYTDQATTLDIDKAQCLKYVEDGIYNPYLADEYQDQTPANRSYGYQEQQEQSRPQVSQLGGRSLPSLTEGNNSDLDVIQ
jgi:hypothetical protein